MEPIINDSTADKPESELSAKEILDRYKMEIQYYEKEYRPWERRGTKIVKRYKDERAATQTNPTRFNILYSNVQTLQPAAFGGNPKADIERRFKDDDVLGRVTADILERCTNYFITEKFADTIRHCLQDRLLPGRGVSWVRYVPHFRDAEIGGNQEIAEEGTEITDEVYPDTEPTQEVYYEEVCHDYVFWKDFGHNVARTWPEVHLVWRKAFLDKDELIERFGKKIALLCPMDYSPTTLSDEKKSEVIKKSTIYELWNEKTKKAYWAHKDVDQFLDIKDDPLGLPDFFPCPKPLSGITTNDSLVPVPDYAEYQDQAMELDELTSRISNITKSIKVVGVYDASAQGVERMLNEGVENRLIAVESWAVFGEKGGLKGVVEFMPMKEIAEVLLSLYEAREKVKQDLYEITGIADIIRGATKASETATAQNIKSQFATLRLDQLQHAVARFARDMVLNTALIIAKHFSLDTIKQISGVKLLTTQEKQQIQAQMQMAQQTNQPLPPMDDQMQEMLDNPTWEEVHTLLQDEPHLCFRIDIETDSTVKQDQETEQQARVQLLESAGSFIQQSAEVAQMQPELMPLLAQMLLFGIRGFKVGKSIEGTFRTVLSKIEKQAAQPQPPKPDPEMAKAQSQAELQKQDQMHSQQMQTNKQQFEQQKADKESQQNHQKEIAQMQADAIVQAAKEKRESDYEQRRLELGDALDRARMDKEFAMKERLALIDRATALQSKMFENKESDDSGNGVDINAMIKPIIDALQDLAGPRKVTLDNGRSGISELM